MISGHGLGRRLLQSLGAFNARLAAGNEITAAIRQIDGLLIGGGQEEIACDKVLALCRLD